MKRLSTSIVTSFLIFAVFFSSSSTKASTKIEDGKKDSLPLTEPNLYEKIIPKKLKGLVVLIDFSDAPANVTLDRADSVINGFNYTEPTVTSSIRKYWLKQSRGKIDLQHDVVGYFRAPKTAEWYKKQNWTVFLDLSKQALEWFKKENPNYDWNSLSVSSDKGEEGTLLSINFFTTEWIAGSGGTHRIDDWSAPNGRKLGQITAQNFLAPSDKNINLFWFNHELGHSVWSVPDTYDHDGSSASTGSYSVMSGNRSNGQIEAFGAPFLMRQKWVDVIDLVANRSYTIKEDGNTIYRYSNPTDKKEYFLIEARKKSTLGNEMIPAERGLLVWHVDENVKMTNDKEDMTPTDHYAHAIVQADGKYDLEHGRNKADAGDYFIEGSTFSDNTIPNSKWWNGQPSNLKVQQIKFHPNNKYHS